MEFEYEKKDFKGNPKFGIWGTFEEDVLDQILYKETWGQFSNDTEKMRLEEQPVALCRAFGRLLEILTTKGIIDIDNLHEILDSRGDFRRTAKLK